MPVQGQLAILAALAGCGAALGAGYDLYNTVLQERRGWRRLTPVADLAFWTVGLAAVFRVLLAVADGEMRLSFLAVIALGCGLYRVLVRHAVVRSASRAVRVATYCLRAVRTLFLAAVWRPLVGTARVALALAEGILRILSFFENIILWPVWLLIRLVRRGRARTSGEAEASRRRPLWKWPENWDAWVQKFRRKR